MIFLPPIPGHASQVVQQIPPIVVTLQPPSGEMPEWVKILITAVVGALVGFISSILMEYIKPYIAKKLLKKTLSAQLAKELLKNLNHVEAGKRVIESAEKKAKDEREFALNSCCVLARLVESDKYDFYFASEKSAVDEIDEDGTLATFYKVVKQLAETAPEDKNYESMKRFFIMAAFFGHGYVELHNLTYISNKNPIEESYNAVLADNSNEEQKPSDDFVV
jgi:hypothetical protein